MGDSITDIIGMAESRETSTTLCLAGRSAAELQRLEDDLVRIGGDWQPSSLAEKDPRVDLAQQIQALREKMRAAERTFRFRALDDIAWSDLLAAHPPRPGKQEAFNLETLPPVLISSSAIEPKMTTAQYLKLAPKLNQAQRNALFDAAWSANMESTSVPFSLAASAILAGTEPR